MWWFSVNATSTLAVHLEDLCHALVLDVTAAVDVAALHLSTEWQREGEGTSRCWESGGAVGGWGRLLPAWEACWL